MNTFETLLVNDQSPILEVTLNRPKQANAMNLKMVYELMDVMSHAAESDYRILLLKGCEGNFCAGGDIKDMQSANKLETQDEKVTALSELNRAFGRMIQLADKLPLVTVCVLEGAVLGGGFGLACVSDYAVCDETTVFGLPETSLGILPAQIAPFVVKRIGLTQTRRLALMGQRFKGEEAVRLGVIHQQVTADQVNETLNQAIKQILKCGPEANKATKALLHTVNECSSLDSLDTILDQAANDFAEAVLNGEGREGAMAFMQKRKPSWAEAKTQAGQESLHEQ
ncbi:enoyl-CoA hydratase/isomerase family protein [Litoribacillus peritrichatus]|uniref:Isohexenylglutaconyl-CoA hydratase n=1 Tax=Litoribacillus peritrichatus TaxID=718191 RepID=A0ABP7M896_9GAMM